MFSTERQTIIYNHLRKHGSVNNTQLAQLLDVTPMTIRRDLDEMEQKNVIRRVQGGAVLIGSGLAESDFIQRSHDNVEEKLAIAQEAVKLVADGMSIGLDASSTVLEVARLLPHFCGLTVVTNSIQVTWELRDKSEIELIVLGGTVGRDGNTIEGPLAAEQSSRMYLDLMFLSCAGFDREGVTNSSVIGSEVRKNLVHNAKKKILLADHTKYEKRGFVRLFDWPELDVLVSDCGASPESVTELKNQHPQLEIRQAAVVAYE